MAAEKGGGEEGERGRRGRRLEKGDSGTLRVLDMQLGLIGLPYLLVHVTIKQHLRRGHSSRTVPSPPLTRETLEITTSSLSTYQSLLRIAYLHWNKSNAKLFHSLIPIISEI